ncbi:MAG: tetratricopeptide repeat protein [Nitrosopumilus sp.]|nr:tetratricopeptide repeat protein [Nitrosopumilus sp.]
MSTVAEPDDGTMFWVITALERSLFKLEAAVRYDIDRMIDDLAHTLESSDICPREQSLKIMEDYIRDPKKYDEIKRGPPDCPRPNHGTRYLSRLLSQLGRHEEALGLAEADLAAWPDSAAAWLSKSRALYGLGRREEALACAERSLDLNPGYRIAAGFRTRLLASMGRYREALDYATGYPDYDLLKRSFLGGVGLALAGLGRREEALKYLRVASRSDVNPGELEAARRRLAAQNAA